MKNFHLEFVVVGLIAVLSFGCSKFESKDKPTDSARQEELLSFVNNDNFTNTEKESMVGELILLAESAEDNILEDMKKSGCTVPSKRSEDANCEPSQLLALNIDSYSYAHGLPDQLQKSIGNWSSILQIPNLSKYASEEKIKDIEVKLKNANARYAKLVVQPRNKLLAENNKNWATSLEKSEMQMMRDFGIQFIFAKTAEEMKNISKKFDLDMMPNLVGPEYADPARDAEGRPITMTGQRYNGLFASRIVVLALDPSQSTTRHELPAELKDKPIDDPEVEKFYAQYRNDRFKITQKVKEALLNYYSVLSTYSDGLSEVALFFHNDEDEAFLGLSSRTSTKLWLLDASLKSLGLVDSCEFNPKDLAELQAALDAGDTSVNKAKQIEPINTPCLIHSPAAANASGYPLDTIVPKNLKK